MSETAIFAIGAVVWAVTVYGAVMTGGLLLSRDDEDEESDGRD